MKQKYRIRGFSCVSRSLKEYQVSPRKGFRKYHQVPFGVSKRYFRPILTWQTYGLCSIAAKSMQNKADTHLRQVCGSS